MGFECICGTATISKAFSRPSQRRLFNGKSQSKCIAPTSKARPSVRNRHEVPPSHFVLFARLSADGGFSVTQMGLARPFERPDGGGGASPFVLLYSPASSAAFGHKN
jgi:hypothetical protein